ncbi:MAG TPA: histidine phosphatase family protein [Anaerolineaceae bacterium]|nr:histidine phosphatase family protein [Anaerolineaceae bacterium]
MPTLLLIRHGENDVMHKRLAGRMPEVHLNAKGRRQAAELAEMLKHLPIKAIYSSPLERAVETAEPLAKALGLDVQLAPGLLEVDYGRWQGRTYKQLRRQKLWKTVQETPVDVRFPDGETLEEVQQRVLTQIEGLLGEDEVVACFAHGDIIRLAMVHYLNMEINSFQRLVIHPASVSAVHLGKAQPYVLCVNLVRGFELPKEKEEQPQKEAEEQKDGHV